MSNQLYSDSHDAHFIAGGRTLEIIKKFEEDLKNRDVLLLALAHDCGAEKVYGFGSTQYFTSKQPLAHPALALEKDESSSVFTYRVNADTPEGRLLQERIDDIPGESLRSSQFGKRLTGREETVLNPDKINFTAPSDYSLRHFRSSDKQDSANFRRFGNTYVVSVPRTVRAIFNKESEKRSQELRGIPLAAGYRYEWFTPPDSKPIPYSKVVVLQEKELGNQTKPREVMTFIGIER